MIKRLHAEFHKTAASILSEVDVGSTSEAEELLASEFAEKSSILVRALSKWKAELQQ